jgi:glucosamine--fructose-6-phosphate aminotransferase (isomerizing)
MSMTAGARYEAEIREQPGALARLLSQGRASAEALAARLRESAVTYALIAARGSSDNAARYAQYLFGIHNRLTVALAVPSVVTLYDVAPNMAGALVIGISQSGQSPDIVSVLQAARAQGCVTLAITNDPASPLAGATEHVFPLLAGEERAVAATKTYTSELMAIALLSAALEGKEERFRELAQVPEYVQETIDSNIGAVQGAGAFCGAEHLVVLGRGFNYATAHEASLKLEETSYLVAEPYSLADLYHGPVAVIGEGFPVLWIAPSGKTLVDAPKLLETVEKRGARLIAISDEPDVLAHAELGLRLPSGMPEWVSPFAAIVAAQLLAGALARESGLDPDRPRGLSKVTRTR